MKRKSKVPRGPRVFKDASRGIDYGRFDWFSRCERVFTSETVDTLITRKQKY